MANFDSLTLKFAELRDIFPLLSDETIIVALALYNNDVQAAIEHILQNGTIQLDKKDKQKESLPPSPTKQSSSLPEVDQKVNLLLDMFPDIDSSDIRTILEQNALDVERTTEELLSKSTIETLTDEQNQEQEIDYERLEDDERERNRKRWTGVDRQIHDIVELTAIPWNEAKSYLQSNKTKCDAIVDIIRNYRRRKSQDPTGKSKKNIPKGGRVQGSYSGMSASTTLDGDDDYSYNEDSPEVKELADYVYNDKTLSEIHWSFYEESLKFFEGEVSKVLTVAIFIHENKGIKATYNSAPPKLDFSTIADGFRELQQAQLKRSASSNSPYQQEQQQEQQQQFSTVSKKKRPSLISTARSDSEKGLEPYEITMQRIQLNKACETHQIDLHGFHVKNARLTCSNALKQWWADELRAREIHGNTAPSSKAREIPPLTVVTGRGIHSEGGFSKIRASVKKFLTTSQYIFQEESSRFIVQGKR